MNSSVVAKAIAGLNLLFVLSASAAWTGKTYTWTGSAGDGLWSTPGNWTTDGVTAAATAPTQIDKAIFGSSSGSGVAKVDAAFGPAGVMYLTIESGYAGSVVLEKDFAVWHEYTQNGGTFTCGEHNFQIGKCAENLGGLSPTYGHFYLNAGTFNAPKGKELRWWSRSHECYFKVQTAATFTTDDTDFSLRSKSQGGVCTFACGGHTFRDFTLWTPATPDSYAASQTRYAYTGTNTVTRTFAHGGGWLQGSSSVAYGSAAFRILGDVVITNVPYSGGTGFTYIFDGAGDQTVRTYLPVTQKYCIQTGGIYVDKPSGTLNFIGGLCGVKNSGAWSYPTHGLTVKRGTVDMSKLDKFHLSCYNNDLVLSDGATVIWPKTLSITDYKCNASLKDQTFNDLDVAATDSRVTLGASTNVVSGDLYVRAGGLNGSTAYIDLRGDYHADNSHSADHATKFGGGSAWIMMTNAIDQTIFATNASINSLIIDKPAKNRVMVKTEDGALTLGHVGGQYVSGAGSMQMRGGILDVSNGGIYMKKTCNATLKQTGGTILWGSLGLLVYMDSGGHSSTLNFGTNYVPRLVMTGAHGGNNNLNCGTLYAGDVIQDGCQCSGNSVKLYIYGNHSISNDTKQPGSHSIIYSGDRNQRVYIASGMNISYSWPNSAQMKKTGGILALDNDIHVGNNSDYGSFTINGGTIDPNGHTLAAQNTITLSSRALFSGAKGCLTANKMYVNDGATIAFDMPTDAETPPFITGNFVYMPTQQAQATNTIEVVGRVWKESPRRVDLIQATNTLISAGCASLTLPTWKFAENQNVGKPSVVHESDTKTLYFTYKYRGATCIILK